VPYKGDSAQSTCQTAIEIEPDRKVKDQGGRKIARQIIETVRVRKSTGCGRYLSPALVCRLPGRGERKESTKVPAHVGRQKMMPTPWWLISVSQVSDVRNPGETLISLFNWDSLFSQV